MHSKVHKMEQRNDGKTSINNPFTIMVYLTIEERGNPTLIV